LYIKNAVIHDSVHKKEGESKRLAAVARDIGTVKLYSSKCM
jgi:hypothetical protein